MNSSHTFPLTLTLAGLAVVFSSACAAPSSSPVDSSDTALSDSPVAAGVATLSLQRVSPPDAIDGSGATLRLVASTLEIEAGGRLFRAPVSNRFSDFCNVITTSAFEDQRSVDGVLTSITLTDRTHVDNASAACRTSHAGISVTLKVEAAGNTSSRGINAAFVTSELVTTPTYSCRSADPNGFRVEVWTKTGATAPSEARVFKGAQLADVLRSSVSVDSTGPVGADISRTFASFKNVGIADGGFSVSLARGGYAGLTQALLTETTYFGETNHGSLICEN